MGEITDLNSRRRIPVTEPVPPPDIPPRVLIDHVTGQHVILMGDMIFRRIDLVMKPDNGENTSARTRARMEVQGMLRITRCLGTEVQNAIIRSIANRHNVSVDLAKVPLGEDL